MLLLSVTGINVSDNKEKIMKTRHFITSSMRNEPTIKHPKGIVQNVEEEIGLESNQTRKPIKISQL